ncbi:hypothetical protein [Maridesulfovibrio sp.]|uniref:hypothetical protein n=1 Tax=Maridesulfovibrio sp. TaxID=2795000 RepID=UPI002AA912D9|nr:hypothetical protein [Maridesulfovibrio sp.]
MREQKTVITCDLCGEEMETPRPIKGGYFDGHKNHSVEILVDVCPGCLTAVTQRVRQAREAVTGECGILTDRCVEPFIAYELAKANNGQLTK